ncbi:hypothetical protein [Glycomyces harbinensis]|uniref:Uncharacterized protein n=1 Tax=Glycomyces harbinensis TaxID=58114 RepID=A0A1G6SI47_9ACTN|nr:hypothetical protein [Glycomyces harbinensis]SDD16518.1 hypothetical protein SAMN05216270_102114 [Glycomyces harbinensis]
MLRIGIAALSVLVLTAGCSWFEGEEEDLDFGAYEGRLTDMYNEGVRLIEELDAAEARIVQACLEEQGFDAHPPEEFTSWAGAERESFLDEAPYAWFMPTAEEAARRGFWQWTAMDAAEDPEHADLYAEYEAHQEAAGRAAPEWTEEGAGTPEFYLLDAEDQYAWYVAYAGETWAAEMHPDLGGPGRKTDASGDEVYTNPPPEGCKREMIEAVYGELVGTENEEEGFTDWTFRPEQPMGDWEDMTGRYADRTADAEGDLLDCLDDRGRGGWEFYNGNLLVHEYLAESGEGTHSLYSYEDSGTVWPDAPDDAPDADDFEGWMAFERDLAVDFAECGDESGFRETAEHAWEQAQLHFYLDIEDDTYAWQEEMRGHLAKTQELIGG